MKLTKEKKLACAACDVLVGLSRGTLKRAITKAPLTNDVCVSAADIKALFNALEAAYPGFYERAKRLTEEQTAKTKPARDARFAEEQQKRAEEIKRLNEKLQPKGRYVAFRWIPDAPQGTNQ